MCVRVRINAQRSKITFSRGRFFCRQQKKLTEKIMIKSATKLTSIFWTETVQGVHQPRQPTKWYAMWKLYFFRHFREIQSRKKETKKDIAKCAKSRKIFRRSFRTGDWLNRAAKMLITSCRRNEIVKSFTNERVAKKIKYRKFWPKRVKLTTEMLFLDSQKSPLLTIITVVFSLDKIMRMSNNTRCEWFISNSHSMSSRDVAKYINSTVIFVLHFYSCLPKMSIWQ